MLCNVPCAMIDEFPLALQRKGEFCRYILRSCTSPEIYCTHCENQSKLCFSFVFAIFVKIYLEKVVRFIEIFITLFSNRHIVK